MESGRQDKGVGTQICVSAYFTSTYREPSVFLWVLPGSIWVLLAAGSVTRRITAYWRDHERVKLYPPHFCGRITGQVGDSHFCVRRRCPYPALTGRIQCSSSLRHCPVGPIAVRAFPCITVLSRRFPGRYLFSFLTRLIVALSLLRRPDVGDAPQDCGSSFIAAGHGATVHNFSAERAWSSSRNSSATHWRPWVW